MSCDEGAVVVPVPPCATVSVPVSVERERQVPEIEKQPVATLIPAPNDDVADPVTSSLMAVVDPVAESSVKMDEVVVAKVVSEEVEKYNFELIALKLNGEFVRDPSERVNCGSVDDASCSVQRGVVVPSPKYPFPAAAVVYAEFVTAPKAVPDERYWISVAVPAGNAPEVRQVLPIAKHPVESEIPTFEVVVAEPEIFKPERVVVPKPSPATVKNFVAFEDEATSKTGLVCAAVACTASFAYGDVVAIPNDPERY